MHRLIRHGLLAAVAVAGCRSAAPPSGLTLMPVLVQDGAMAGVNLAADVAGAVARFLVRHGVEATVGRALVVADRTRSATLVDFPEAARPCDAVITALGLDLGRGQVLVVLGGHISSTQAFRQLYGTSCGGRAEDCSAAAADGGIVLVDRLDADEIDLAVVAAHEVGHVLGLRHPFEPDCAGAEAPIGAADLMAIERDVSDGRSTMDHVSLAGLTLTAAQVATIREAAS